MCVRPMSQFQVLIKGSSLFSGNKCHNSCLWPDFMLNARFVKIHEKHTNDSVFSKVLTHKGKGVVEHGTLLLVLINT